jgi:hypothetical protein
MENGVHIVRFSRLTDGAKDHIHCLSSAVFVGLGGMIQFASRHPFVIRFPNASPFVAGTGTTITGINNGSEYRSSVLTVQNPGAKTTPYSYSVTLDPGNNPLTEDPQVIVDPDQSGLPPLLLAGLAGAIGGALAAILLNNKK